MPLGHRSARRRGMLMGAAIASSRNKSQPIATTPQVTPVPARPAQQEADYIEQLKKLGELRDSGILTEEEFAAKKKKILGI